ncbi:uncharacterized protein K452DRAFT_357137 [Aplosporella prunicola CBS 121167]|uniref:Uncharacterized protein n=1 Tax=Aplosporella prunicola CBS 121167 TaxID=1176127 RepID=A0A6A6BLT4_9PEZI|nr:uncharacterized protein K452DRAFT_357137 [Aplosporella prunicola CBS 121167]KAF2144244.1 hypothetical protein K452DRAFT_357137 [Aplosporella prunicola CBS 121167]
MERRNFVFQQLKPHCVGLSQAALRIAGNNGNPRDVVTALAALLDALKEAKQYPGALNDKLAEYVFFPLSHVLREKQKLPVVAIELTLQCLTIILQTGWRSNIEPALSGQLLILLTVFAGGTPGNKPSPQSSEELQCVAFQCLSELFVTYEQSEKSRKSLTDASNIPPLGHAITVILEGVAEGPSNDIQLAAVQALRSCCLAVKDRDALASFLPGMVSALAKVLTPATKQRRSYEILRISLEVLSQLFRAVISDRATKDLPASAEPTATQTANDSQGALRLTQSWLKATTAQIKLALANIIRIRQHERKHVRQALLDLCLIVLEECRESLKDSAAMMVETMAVLCGSDDDGAMQNIVRHVITADPRLAELLRSSIHSWVVSLPRVLQSPDDAVKRRLVVQISIGYELLADQGTDLDIVDRAMATNLRDGISTCFSDQPKIGEITQTKELSNSLELTAPLHDGPSKEFQPIMYENKNQQEIVGDLQNLVKHVSSSKSSLTAARELVDSLQSSKGTSQLANFWVSLQLIKFSAEKNSVIDAFLDFGDASMGPNEEILEEMYSFSLDVLQESSLEPQADWRLQALAVETIAFQAETLKSDFRLELVESLYPIVHLVGSPIPQLRNHAITCLNIMAAACDYKDVGSLIVENVDYLVNAVALKLNTFDISPQAPQVLLMMIKLSGPTLLPYLDDLVSSVFAALESFHGYPKLVEMLFSVLKGIAEEGTKTPQLAITEGEESITHYKPASKPTSIQDVVSILKAIQSRERRKDDEDDTDSATPFPRRAWKEKIEQEGLPTGDSNDENENQEETQENGLNAITDDAPPPAPKTYALLLKISSLTQHYLSAPSPTLRTSLLGLLSTTLPALARHESSLLPLINALWPSVLPRLHDTEPYVVAGACDAVAAMCVYAGEFMRSRIEDVWAVVLRLYRSGGIGGSSSSISSGRNTTTTPIASLTASMASTSLTPTPTTTTQTPAHYTPAPTRLIRAAALNLVTTALNTLTLDDAAVAEALDLLLPVVVARADVRAAFERWNADAVWLAVLGWEVRGGWEQGRGKGSGKVVVEEESDEGVGRRWGVGERPEAWEGREFVRVFG